MLYDPTAMCLHRHPPASDLQPNMQDLRHQKGKTNSAFVSLPFQETRYVYFLATLIVPSHCKTWIVQCRQLQRLPADVLN